MKKHYEKLQLRIIAYEEDILTQSIAADRESILYFNKNWLGIEE